MKRFSRSVIETIAIGGVNIGILLYTISFFLFLLYGLFDIKPYYLSGGTRFGLIDFEKGIPVNVRFNEELQNTTYSDTAKSTATYNIYRSEAGPAIGFKDSIFSNKKLYTDTIITHYTILGSAPHHEDGFMLTAIRMDKGVVNIQTKNIGLRLLFLLPLLLGNIIAVCCMWQISGLLNNISKGVAFQAINLRRLQIVGGLVIAYQVILFFLSGYSYHNMETGFSFFPYNRSLVKLYASPYYDFSTNWLIIGTSILIIASAFKKGIQLQQDQDLTI